MRRIALVVLAAACSGERARDSEPPSGKEPAEQRAARPDPAIAPAADAAVPAPTAVIPAETRQLVLATVEDWDDVTATFARFERSPGGAWTPVGEAWPAVIGAGGSGWGRGLHGEGAPAGQDGPVKVEGDGKSPAGAFALGAAFGYAARPPAGTRAPYIKVGGSWRCIDDGASAHYNRVLDTAGLPVDWSSAEVMRREDDLYRWGLLVEHNPSNTPGAGSCIFVHVWCDAQSGTAGCTAMERGHVESLLTWLDPAAKPVFVLLPSEHLTALRDPWHLP